MQGAISEAQVEVHISYQEQPLPIKTYLSVIPATEPESN